MRKHIFPLAISSFLIPPICLVALQVFHSTHGAVGSVSQPRDRVGREARESCLVTKPPTRPFVPPSPYPAETSPDSFWFGTVKLWTRLPADGTWRGLPHYTPDDPTFRQKLFFWRQGYKSELPPQLRVTGRRLDASAPPLAYDGANAGWQSDMEHPFMVTGVNFPTLGCWEVTADYRDDKLMFVVRVAP